MAQNQEVYRRVYGQQEVQPHHEYQQHNPSFKPQIQTASAQTVQVAALVTLHKGSVKLEMQGDQLTLSFGMDVLKDSIFSFFFMGREVLVPDSTLT